MWTITKTSKSFYRIILAGLAICCCFFAVRTTHALEFEPKDGNGWSYSSDRVLTIENDQGWAECLKKGYPISVNELVIGKDVTKFRMYIADFEAPTDDFYDPSDIAGYDRNGKPYYEFFSGSCLSAAKITVEEGNPIYRVVNGLLINITTQELVLSESNVLHVIIPEGVVAITRGAFDSRVIQSVQFPTTLKIIGENAFADCEYLEKVVLPESLLELSLGAFSGCKNLSEVILPEGLKTLGSYAFTRCGITKIELPESLEEMDSYAFLQCEQLQEVKLPSGLKTIQNSVFGMCKNLQSINLPEGLKLIGEQAFAGCYNLRRVILPSSLEHIGDRAYWGCYLQLLNVPPHLAFLVFDERTMTDTVNPYRNRHKAFDLSSVEIVIFTGSDYDFGYHAITDAENVYFLGTPPEEVGSFLDKETVENIYCSDEFEFQWTRSKVSSWVRQKLTVLPAAELNAIVEEQINTTPIPLETPTPMPSETPLPTPIITPEPTATPILETEETGIDPILFVFAGVIALVVAGIVVVSCRGTRKKKQTRKNR